MGEHKSEMFSVLVTKPEPQLNFSCVKKEEEKLYEIGNDKDEAVAVKVVDVPPSSSGKQTTAFTVPTTTTTLHGIPCESFSCSCKNESCSCSSTSTSNNNAYTDQTTVEEGSGENTSYEDDEQEYDQLRLTNYFDFLDDYIRFDVTRTGVSCLSGYSVSVQYEDDFLVGKAGTPCCIPLCSAKSRVRLWHQEKALELEYLPRVSCTRPKNCVYRVRIPNERKEVGTIHFRNDLVRIYNTCNKGLSLRRKQGTNCYSIKTEAGDRLASVEIFRGFRGDIMYYGVSILGDASSSDKALLIGLTIAMDIRQRESEMRCSLIWVPLFCVIVVGVFSLFPWIFFYDTV